MPKPKQKSQEPLPELLVRLAPGEEEVVDPETGEVRRAGDPPQAPPPVAATVPVGRIPAKTSDPPPVEVQAPRGLVMRGSVVRRRRRQVGENQIEVVTYTLGPRLAEFEVWRPTRYLQIGEAVEVEVIPHLDNNRVTFPVPQEETF